MPQPRSRAPMIIFEGQVDTKLLEAEYTFLLHLTYPWSIPDRFRAINQLRAFAIKWEVKCPEFNEPEDYVKSIRQFETVKGEILKKATKDITRISLRDKETIEAMFGAFKLE